MALRGKMKAGFEAVHSSFEKQFGFPARDVTFARIVEYLHSPKDSSSLAITRILYGIAMLFDITDERGGATMDRRWGDPRTCHFPLLPFLRAVPMPYMAGVYAVLWLGALGIALGFKYKLSSWTFAACYWYLFLIEKSFWNNHSYLFGIVAILLACSDANCYWSLDAYLQPSKLRTTVPYWNYFVLKYQFFILYFMAGMKKGTAEWLTGYSVQNLSEHWVFAPFRLFMTVPQIDYLVVHWFIFGFDLTVAVWMMWSRTRNAAMLFCALFHLMNSRLFRIGMFPWVCLATMPLFYPFDWPKHAIPFLKLMIKNFETRIQNLLFIMYKKQTCQCKPTDRPQKTNECSEKKKENNTEDKKVHAPETGVQSNKNTFLNIINTTNDVCKIEKSETTNKGHGEKINKIHAENNVKNTLHEGDERKKIRTTVFLFFYIFLQAFLPYSHFITQGYNNWTEGLYGYSWDMMVHTWDSHSVVVKVFNQDSRKELFVEPSFYTLNDRWTRHNDMVYQYAQCLRENLLDTAKQGNGKDFDISSNISIYVDVWCSMNGRFTQRMFDTRVDLLQASWSPFTKTGYLMPLLDEALHWRETLAEIREDVHSWSNISDVVFFADFPGYELEKFIPLDLSNVTLTVLQGVVAYHPEVTDTRSGHSYKLTTGAQIDIPSGLFHAVKNIGDQPAYFMYTFMNTTEVADSVVTKQKLPIFKELSKRFGDMFTFASLMFDSIFKICWFPSCR